KPYPDTDRYGRGVRELGTDGIPGLATAARPGAPGLNKLALREDPHAKSIAGEGLELLDLAVGQFSDRQYDWLLGKTNLIQTKAHAAALLPFGLPEFFYPSKRSQAGGEVLDGLWSEVAVRVFGKQSAIEPTGLQSFENLAISLHLGGVYL